MLTWFTVIKSRVNLKSKSRSQP